MEMPNLALATIEWNKFYEAWKAAVEDLGFSVEPLFQTASLDVANAPVADDETIFWWGSASIDANLVKLQQVKDGVVTTMGAHDRCTTSRGIKETLGFLWRFRADPRAIAAVLTAASLRPRILPAVAGYEPVDGTNGTFELGAEMTDLYNQARNYLKAVDPEFKGWWPTMKIVLPNPVGRRVPMEDLPAVIAEEHVALLKAWRPVEVEYTHTAERAEIVKAQVGERSAKWYANRRSKAPARYAEEKAKRLENVAAKRKAWAALTDAQLKVMVWSKPSRVIATELGVSDVMIAKRCKKAGIAKPPRGFWWRVELGQEAHPNGVAPSQIAA